jgi:hypothetical protein
VTDELKGCRSLQQLNGVLRSQLLQLSEFGLVFDEMKSLAEQMHEAKKQDSK